MWCKGTGSGQIFKVVSVFGDNSGKCFRYQEETLDDVNHLQQNVNFIRKLWLGYKLRWNPPNREEPVLWTSLWTVVAVGLCETTCLGPEWRYAEASQNGHLFIQGGPI